MKRVVVFLVFMLLVTQIANSQEQVSASIFQDVKLGLGQDKKHGNDKPTMDLIFNIDWEGDQQEFHYFAVRLQYEHALLSSGYFSRYSMGAMWNFNKLIVDNLTISTGVGIGMIHRPSPVGGSFSYSGTLEVSYKILDWLEAALKNELVDRSDLENKKFGYNVAAGLKFRPFHN